MKTNPNDPVSPCKVYKESGSNVLGDILAPKPGLTIRQYFAAMAMQGILSNDSSLSYEFAGKEAVSYADALILALNESSTKD